MFNDIKNFSVSFLCGECAGKARIYMEYKNREGALSEIEKLEQYLRSATDCDRNVKHELEREAMLLRSKLANM